MVRPRVAGIARDLTRDLTRNLDLARGRAASPRSAAARSDLPHPDGPSSEDEFALADVKVERAQRHDRHCHRPW